MLMHPMRQVNHHFIEKAKWTFLWKCSFCVERAKSRHKCSNGTLFFKSPCFCLNKIWQFFSFILLKKNLIQFLYAWMQHNISNSKIKKKKKIDTFPIASNLVKHLEVVGYVPLCNLQPCTPYSCGLLWFNFWMKNCFDQINFKFWTAKCILTALIMLDIHFYKYIYLFIHLFIYHGL